MTSLFAARSSGHRCNDIHIHLLLPGTETVAVLRRIYKRGTNSVLMEASKAAPLSVEETNLFPKHEVEVVLPPLAHKVHLKKHMCYNHSAL